MTPHERDALYALKTACVLCCALTVVFVLRGALNVAVLSLWGALWSLAGLWVYRRDVYGRRARDKMRKG